jgi:hypothetical protein
VIRVRRWLAAAGAVLVLAALAPEARAATAPNPSDRWAVLVGVNDYAGSTHDTVGAVGDVDDLHAYLVRAGFAEDHILVLEDGQASAQAIRDALRWLGDRSTDTSLSVFHFSGHVKQASAADGDAESLDVLLWAADNRFISDGELTQWVKRIRGRSWTDIAGCEAAGFDDGLSGPQRLFTSSSLEHEKSFERRDWQNSVFTGLLVDYGMLQKQADADGNSRVSIQEAFRYAEAQAPRITANQSPGPQHPLLAGGDGTDWYLSLTKPPAAARSHSCFVLLRCGAGR